MEITLLIHRGFGRIQWDNLYRTVLAPNQCLLCSCYYCAATIFGIIIIIVIINIIITRGPGSQPKSISSLLRNEGPGISIFSKSSTRLKNHWLSVQLVFHSNWKINKRWNEIHPNAMEEIPSRNWVKKEWEPERSLVSRKTDPAVCWQKGSRKHLPFKL